MAAVSVRQGLALLERAGLEPFTVERLWAGLEPATGSWRAHARWPPVLPAHPIMRQGGHPDGT